MTTVSTLVQPVRARVIFACAISGCGAALAVGPAIATAELASCLIRSPGDTTRVWTWVWFGVLTAGLASCASLTASTISHRTDADFRVTTRRTVIDHLARVSLGWFVTHGSGEVKKAVGDDVRSIHTLVAHTCTDVSAALVGPVVALAYLFWNNWLFTLILLGYIVVCLGIAVPRMNSGYQKNMAAWEEAQGRFQSGAVEVVEGIEVVKSYGTSSGVFTRFSSAVDQLSQIAVRWMSAINGPNILLTNLFSTAGLTMWIAATGIGLIAVERMDATGLIAFLAVGTMLPSGLMNIVQLGYATREAQAAAGHLKEVLDSQPLPETDRPAQPRDASIAFEKVTFAYDDGTVALDGVNAYFAPGSVTAVVGPSGSGKTTLARLVPRFWDATSGRVLIGGVDVRQVPSDELLGRVAMVFQETLVLRDTVAGNLRLGRADATDGDLVTAAQAARIHNRIMTLPHGYDTILGEDGGDLSGGERQRLAIARAILQDAPVVILDEATAHADPESEAEVQLAVSKLVEGRTVIVIAHRLHTVAGADNILVLDGGRVVERGTHDDLLATGGAYARMWALQNGENV